VLILSIVLFTRDVVPAWMLDALQVANGLLVPLVGGVLQRSLRTRPTAGVQAR
jgi:hypothetical protein